MRFNRSLQIGFGILAIVCFLGCTQSGGNLPISEPVFTTQPSSQTVPSGGTAVFNVAVSGTPAPSLSWERSNDGGATWSLIPGATSSIYSLVVGPTDTRAEFRSIAANSVAITNSLPATLTEVPAVYSGGDIDTSYPIPGYWQNGNWVGFDQPSSPSGWVNTLVVSGGTIYAAGVCSNSVSDAVQGYWGNGGWTKRYARRAFRPSCALRHGVSG